MQNWSTTTSFQSSSRGGSAAGAAVRTDGVSVVYDDGHVIEAVRGVSFGLRPGVSCALIGPSGCGKSTLLYVLAGLRRPTGGAVWVNDEPVTGPRRDTALILQDYGLLAWKTLYDNVALGLQIRRVGRRRRDELVRSWLEKLGLWSVRKLLPAQLSGGQRQRTAVARSLVLGPDLLLMDEPFSSLDALTRESLQDELLVLARETGLTLIIVTHSIEEAVLLGQQIIVLSDRPGRVIARVDNHGCGKPEYRGTQQFFQWCAELRSILVHCGGELGDEK